MIHYTSYNNQHNLSGEGISYLEGLIDDTRLRAESMKAGILVKVTEIVPDLYHYYHSMEDELKLLDEKIFLLSYMGVLPLNYIGRDANGLSIFQINHLMTGANHE